MDDGGEVDLDLGNYERFMGISMTSKNNITTGKIFQEVIAKERRGDYLGKTVQFIPHITDHIINTVTEVSKIPTDGSESEPEVRKKLSSRKKYAFLVLRVKSGNIFWHIRYTIVRSPDCERAWLGEI